MKLSLAPAISLLVVAAAMVPGVAGAQEAPLPPVTTRDTAAQAAGPRWWLAESGVVLFGFAYVPAVVVAATSGPNADRALFVPVVGPWIDLTQRPGCNTGACKSEDSAKVLIAVDGVVQAIGALSTLCGLLTTAHETRSGLRSSNPPTLRVSPAQMGTGGYGVVALGTF